MTTPELENAELENAIDAPGRWRYKRAEKGTRGMARGALFVLVVLLLANPTASSSAARPADARQTGASPAAPPGLDFEVFRTRVQPIFLNRRKGHARCYACHSQGTTFRLQPLSPGATSWSEEESRQNFEAARRVVTPGNPRTSRLLTMPLAADAGGVHFHPGGKHWTSQADPEWQTLDAWVRGKN